MRSLSWSRNVSSMSRRLVEPTQRHSDGGPTAQPFFDFVARSARGRDWQAIHARDVHWCRSGLRLRLKEVDDSHLENFINRSTLLWQ
jgi:hypothetical protein